MKKKNTWYTDGIPTELTKNIYDYRSSHTLKECGIKYGVSASRVRQVICRYEWIIRAYGNDKFAEYSIYFNREIRRNKAKEKRNEEKRNKKNKLMKSKALALENHIKRQKWIDMWNLGVKKIPINRESARFG